MSNGWVIHLLLYLVTHGILAHWVHMSISSFWNLNWPHDVFMISRPAEAFLCPSFYFFFFFSTSKKWRCINWGSIEQMKWIKKWKEEKMQSFQGSFYPAFTSDHWFLCCFRHSFSLSPCLTSSPGKSIFSCSAAEAWFFFLLAARPNWFLFCGHYNNTLSPLSVARWRHLQMDKICTERKHLLSFFVLQAAESGIVKIKTIAARNTDILGGKEET